MSSLPSTLLFRSLYRLGLQKKTRVQFYFLRIRKVIAELHFQPKDDKCMKMQKPSLRLIIDEDTLCVFSRESVRLVFPETLNVPKICM